MGSADQQFNLAEILSQNYGIREECEGTTRRPAQPEEELDKDFISQVLGSAEPCTPCGWSPAGQTPQFLLAELVCKLLRFCNDKFYLHICLQSCRPYARS